MIPTDLASRISLQNGTAVLPLAAVKEVGAELPPYTPGSRITAQVVAARVDGQFRVLVEGNPNPLLLSFVAPNDQGQNKATGKSSPPTTSPLSGRIAPGDTLQLTVVARAPGTIFASQRTETTSATISPSGRMIAELLSRDERQPVPLAGGQPLLRTQPSAEDFASLPAKLKKTVAESGLFYESHQAQWVSGKRDLAQLQNEPQNQLRGQEAPSTQIEAGNGRNTSATTPSANLTGADSALPAPLQPLVQQQLDAAATREVVWQMQAWPGQNMEWRVSEQQDDKPDYAADENERPWRTALKLTLPHLGSVDASLSLAGQGLQLRLRTDQSDSVTTLQAALPALARALADAGLQLQGAGVQSAADSGAPT